MKGLKILIFDGSFKTTSFINRLAAGLADQNEVYIAGFNEQMSSPVSGVHYIALGSNQNKRRFIHTSLYWALKNKSTTSFVTILKFLLQGKRQDIQERNLLTALNFIQPDIIHLQWTSIISLFEEVLIKQKIPVIISQRGFHTNVKPFVYPKNMEYLKKWYPYFAGFHSVSKAITVNSDKIWNGSEKIDQVVYTGLSLGDFPYSHKDTRTENLKLLSVGRSHWVKGYDYSLKVCRLLKGNNVSFHYTIIGGAGDEKLQFLVDNLELQKNVSLIGKIPQESVKEYMITSSLMLLPSLEEGLPNVLVEAMALGLPVVSTDCGGVPELIEDGVEGWVVPMRDSEAMAEAVISFSKLSLEEIEKVRVAARKKVEVQHNEEQMIRGMEELYEKVIASHRQKINNHEEH